MEKQPKKPRSRRGSKKSLGSDPNLQSDAPSTIDSNWRAKYTANVQRNNSKESLQKQPELENLIATSAGPLFSDSEK